MAKILKCTCKNSYQDAKHGHGRRVHNKTKKGADGANIYRCTVCGSEKSG